MLKLGRNVWVVRYRGGFSVREEGIHRHLLRPVTQRVAIGVGRAIAKANGSELLIQGMAARIRVR